MNALSENSIRSAFDRFDKDGNGKIDLLEFRKLVQDLAEPAARARSSADVEADFDAIDKDAGGLIEYDEFARWWLLRAAFDHHDEGRTGSLGARGFQMLLEALDCRHRPTEIAANFAALARDERVTFADFARWWELRSSFDKHDKNGDGTIDIGEFHLLVDELNHGDSPIDIANEFAVIVPGADTIAFNDFVRWWSTR
jgi:Ca2+-binding EF-hand superfamily protein